MSHEEILGLLIGMGALAAVIGYLTDVYLHPQRFDWLELPQDTCMQWQRIAPGRLMQNGFVEGFDGRMRDESLNEPVFTGTAPARAARGNLGQGSAFRRMNGPRQVR